MSSSWCVDRHAASFSSERFIESAIVCMTEAPPPLRLPLMFRVWPGCHSRGCARRMKLAADSRWTVDGLQRVPTRGM